METRDQVVNRTLFTVIKDREFVIKFRVQKVVRLSVPLETQDGPRPPIPIPLGRVPFTDLRNSPTPCVRKDLSTGGDTGEDRRCDVSGDIDDFPHSHPRK